MHAYHPNMSILEQQQQKKLKRKGKSSCEWSILGASKRVIQMMVGEGDVQTARSQSR